MTKLESNSDDDPKVSDMDIDMVTQVLLNGANGGPMAALSIDGTDLVSKSDGDAVHPKQQDSQTKELSAHGSQIAPESSSTVSGAGTTTASTKSEAGAGSATLADSKVKITVGPSDPTGSSGAGIELKRSMDSNDARIIQYQYAIIKIKEILKNITVLQNDPSNLPMVHYIILYTRSVFMISDKEFSPRLELLGNFKLFKPVPSGINVSATVTHIPYDIPDVVINPLDDLPSLEQAKKCLTLLETLLNSALVGYQKRLDAATKDETLINSITLLLKSTISPLDFDLSLTNMTFPLPPPETRDDDTIIEASLIDMDISCLFTIIKQIMVVMNKIKPIITKYKLMESKKIPSYALHEIFILAVRLNDLYTIFRSFGRKVFLSNLLHLQDQKFLMQAKNGSYLRMCLSKIDDLFNTNKKNGTLIATLTRFIRQNSLFEINSKNIRDFINFVNQGYNVIIAGVATTEDFMMNWVIAELKFRKFYNLPRKDLFEIYSKNAPPPTTKTTPSFSINSGKNQSLSIPTSRARKNSTSSLTSATSSISSLDSFPSIDNTLEVPGSSPTISRGSRSSSVSSVNSNGSIRLPPKSSPQRPQSVFLNGNSSLTKLDTPPKPVIRRRANSQPIANTSPALAGAAAALSKGMRSPLGSIKRKPSVKSTSSPPVTSPTRLSSSTPQASNVTKKLLAVAEEDDNKANTPTKLSANQRLQLHLRQASKTGSLMTQKKEQLTSVTFDPSNPSSVQIRKYAEKTSPPPVAEEVAATPSPTRPVQNNSPQPEEKLPTSITKPTMFGKPTKRDMVTRQNTQLNSRSVQVEERDSPSDESSSSSSSGILKKVRFTGVPSYSEEEDMPTNYANQILKNFASLRAPNYRNHQALKKRDLMLKKEESLSWRNCLHQQDDA